MKRVERLACAGLLMILGVTPAAAQSPPAPAAARSAPDSAPAVKQQQRPRHSWTSDRRHFVTGAVLTVLVDEFTLATADRANLAARDRSVRAGLGADFGMRGGTSVAADGGLRSALGGESRERGQATRQDRLTAELTVRVTEVAPAGLLKVEGRKKIRVDEHEQEIRLAGWVRPEDVTGANTVDSWRIADVEITYASNGKLSKPRGSIIARLLGMIWP